MDKRHSDRSIKAHRPWGNDSIENLFSGYTYRPVPPVKPYYLEMSTSWELINKQAQTAMITNIHTRYVCTM